MFQEVSKDKVTLFSILGDNESVMKYFVFYSVIRIRTALTIKRRMSSSITDQVNSFFICKYFTLYKYFQCA